MTYIHIRHIYPCDINTVCDKKKQNAYFNHFSSSTLHTYILIRIEVVGMDGSAPVSHVVLRSLQLGEDVVGLVDDAFLFLYQVRQRLQLHLLAIGLLALFIQLLLCSVRR